MATLGRLGRRLRRPLTVVPIIAVVGGAFYLGSRAKSGSPAATNVIDRTVDVTSGPMRQTVNASGTLAPADTENLSFAVSGKVTAVGVTAGQHVTKGTVLATLDSAALQSTVTQAQATVDSAQAKLASDTAAVASAAQLAADQANVAAAQASLADANTALAGAALAAPIDGTVSVVNLSVGEQLGSGGTGGTGLTGSGTGSGRTSSASSSGGAGGSQSGAGGSAAAVSSSSSATTTQIQLISTGSYVVDLSVDDTQIGLLKAGQPATITRSNAAVTGAGRNPRTGGQGQAGTAQNAAGAAQAAGQTGNGANQQGVSGRSAPATATGTVTSVGTIATSTSGVSSFPVVVTVGGSPADFFAGATVQVSITYNQLDDVVQVPTAAVTQQNGQSFVTVVNGANRVATPVKVGLVSGGQTQIISGVDAGEQVLVQVTIPAGAAGNGTANRTGGVFGGGGTARTGNGGGFGARGGD